VIQGWVTAYLEATVPLEVRGPGGQVLKTSAIIDTGFNGELMLSSGDIAPLGLQFVGTRYVTLADGSTTILDGYQGHVLWDGQPRDVLVLAASGDPLLGTSLLYGSRVVLDMVGGGHVTIEPIP